jgi:hypothetical protein
MLTKTQEATPSAKEVDHNVPDNECRRDATQNPDGAALTYRDKFIIWRSKIWEQLEQQFSCLPHLLAVDSRVRPRTYRGILHIRDHCWEQRMLKWRRENLDEASTLPPRPPGFKPVQQHTLLVTRCATELYRKRNNYYEPIPRHDVRGLEVLRMGLAILEELTEEMWADRETLEQEWRVSGGKPHPVLSSVMSSWVSLEPIEQYWWLEDVWLR